VPRVLHNTSTDYMFQKLSCDCRQVHCCRFHLSLNQDGSYTFQELQ